ncbi:MAG: aspartate-semialdehyde dehydrogenase [Pelagibacterales bacterium]|nr:aspartate-semialdehyde dehydrogenase [Pelagibacterales bacterium]
MTLKIGIVGATGNVGREMLSILAEKGFKSENIFPIASSRSEGMKVSFGESEIVVSSLEKFNPREIQIALFSAGGEISKEWAPKFANAGCIVIDNSSHFRMDPDVPLIVPEVNADALSGYKKKNIIANPNCSTAQLLVALKPLHDINTIKRVIVSTYQSVSGAGKEGMDELFNQSRKFFANDVLDNVKFTKRIAFNVIPHIDKFMDDGYTKEELKMQQECHKMLDANIKFSATCVRVPVFIGHSEAVTIEFENKMTVADAHAALKAAPGCSVLDDRKDGGYVTPIECAGNDDTYVSRVREDTAFENGLSIWVVSDNLRKGAALNAVQILELLKEKHLN